MIRPLSPHIQVYRPQITSVSSITHRFTMMFLAISLLPWTAFLYYLSLGGASFRWALSLFKTFPGKAYLVLLSFCLVYHFLNGLRHIAWDFGALLDLHVAKKTGWIIFILSFLSSLCVAWRAFV